MSWRLLSLVSVAFGALVALFGGLWWLICKKSETAALDGFARWTPDDFAHL